MPHFPHINVSFGNSNGMMEEVKAKNSLATASPHTLNYLRQQQNLIAGNGQKVSQSSGSSFEMDLFPANSSLKSHDLHVGDVISPSYNIALRSPGTVNGRISRTMYELSEDMKANLLCFTEQCYGGRQRSHEAARIIQRAYRQYRLQKNFNNLRRTAMRHSNNSNSNAVIREALTPKPVTLLSDITPLPTVGSIEDLHGSEAYLKWQKNTEDGDDSSVSSSSKSSNNPVISSTERKDLDSDLKSSQRDSGLSDNSPNDSFKSSRSPSSPNCSFNSDSLSPNQQNFVFPNNNQQQSPSRRPIHASPTKQHHSTCYQCQNTAPLTRRISACNENLKYVLVPTQPGQQVFFTQKTGHHPQVLLCNDKSSSPIYVLAPGTQLVTGTSNKSEFIQPTHSDLANKALQENLNKQRKRLYRIGLNFFNK
ncbi:IQ motif and S7 domain-containing protein 1 [Cichlidogyrus casuarinus]|uniref:IQ motif and S7 domain-containing protein 1 n=1 Tax=Cichlidogyrus casuarinus TaxID=1844966 RepID=A0ABD2Q7S3_9PLAT